MPNRPLPKIKMRDYYRFRSYRVEKDQEECWPWIGGSIKDGYGMFSYKSETYLAHRIAYFLEYATDPGDLMVCHDCDNPSCCNPFHLFLGTSSDNQLDALHKGLRSDSKLNEDLVRQVLIALKSGRSQWKIGLEFNLSQMVISRICRRVIWKHVEL